MSLASIFTSGWPVRVQTIRQPTEERAASAVEEGEKRNQQRGGGGVQMDDFAADGGRHADGHQAGRGAEEIAGEERPERGGAEHLPPGEGGTRGVFALGTAPAKHHTVNRGTPRESFKGTDYG